MEKFLLDRVLPVTARENRWETMVLLLLPSGRASFQGQSHPLQPADLLMLVLLFTGFLWPGGTSQH